MRLVLPLLALTAILSSAAYAQTGRVSSVTSAEPSPPTNNVRFDNGPDGDKVVCRSQEVTGSHFPERVCHTKRQWNDLAADSREATEAVVRNSDLTGCFSGMACH